MTCGGHPQICGIRAFPIACQRCGEKVIYWECWHGSKVFLDPPRTGEHECSTGTSLPPQAWSWNYVRPEPNIRLGLTRFPSEIARWMDMSKRGNTETQQRSIVRKDPTGDQSITLIGDVSHVGDVDLRRKFKLHHKPVLANCTGIHGFESRLPFRLVQDIPKIHEEQ